MGLFSQKSDVSLLVVGLGNPGAEYASTRHNAGFLTLDVLLNKAIRVLQKEKSRCQALASEVRLDDFPDTVALAKPQTFMNRSGRSVKGLLQHYQLDASSLIVIHDDLDIPEHQIRLKQGGGHGGHNGLRDLNSAIGPDYTRVRIGIGRPPGQMPADKYVLQRLSANALEELHCDAQLAAGAVLQILKDGFLAAQNSVNGS
jgi:PTH1 family peptidyl-tRNA hydrolase